MGISNHTSGMKCPKVGFTRNRECITTHHRHYSPNPHNHSPRPSPAPSSFPSEPASVPPPRSHCYSHRHCCHHHRRRVRWFSRWIWICEGVARRRISWPPFGRRGSLLRVRKCRRLLRLAGLLRGVVRPAVAEGIEREVSVISWKRPQLFQNFAVVPSIHKARHIQHANHSSQTPGNPSCPDVGGPGTAGVPPSP